MSVLLFLSQVLVREMGYWLGQRHRAARSTSEVACRHGEAGAQALLRLKARLKATSNSSPTCSAMRTKGMSLLRCQVEIASKLEQKSVDQTGSS